MNSNRRLLLARGAVLSALPFIGSACTLFSPFPTPQFTLSKSGPIELPCRIAPSGHVMLRGRVNDRAETWFVLDTGAPVTVLIDGPRSAALGLDSSGARRLGPDDEPAAPVGVVRREFEIAFDGQLTLSGLSVLVIPQATIPCSERMEASDFAGIIGGDLMRRFVVEVDSVARRVRLHEPRAFKVPDGWAALPLELADGDIFVGAQLLDDSTRPSSTLRIHVDTGAADELSLRLGSHPAIAVGPPATDRGESCFLAGMRPYWRGATPVRLALGDVTVTATQPRYWAAADAPIWRTDYQGTFGISLLARHGPIVDVPGRRLLLRWQVLT
jgi:hypothetical protein